MKKRFTLIVTFLTAIIFNTAAQNNTFPSTGNVGIGTLSPTANLDVNGSTILNMIDPLDYFKVRLLGSQNWGALADFNVVDADGSSNSYGLKISAYNASGNRQLAISQYNTTAVNFQGQYGFVHRTNFFDGITNQYHTDFDIVLKANVTGVPTGIKFYSENLGANPIMSLMQTGNVGININAPTEKLEIGGNIRTTGLIIPTGASLGKVLTSDANGNATWQTAGSSSWSLSGTNLYNSNTGIIFVGTVPSVLPTDANLKLAVNGNVYAKKIKVTATGWADYVFASDYHLRPLKEVAAFIKKHHHLPEVPTAEEVKQTGIDIADTQVLLLKKIEELTLYIIDQDKKMQTFHNKLEAQQNELNQLKSKDL